MSRRSAASIVETQGSVVGAVDVGTVVGLVDVGTVDGTHGLGVGSCVKFVSFERFTANAHTSNDKATTTMTMTDETKARRATFNAGHVDAKRHPPEVSQTSPNSLSGA